MNNWIARHPVAMVFLTWGIVFLALLLLLFVIWEPS